jgi:hypothetical protein
MAPDESNVFLLGARDSHRAALRELRRLAAGVPGARA